MDPALKANIPEVITPPSGAEESSLELIKASLEETADFLGGPSDRDWSGTYYQYANRFAHLYLLCELNGIAAWLVNVYFVGDGDVGGPETEAEWREALTVLEGALGLRRHPLSSRKIDVFIEVGRG